MSGEMYRGPQLGEQAAPLEVQRTQLLHEMQQFGGEEAIIERIGLGVDELMVQGSYGQFEGRLWDAVKDSFIPVDERPAGVVCPVGDGLQRAKQTEGMDGVHKQLAGLGMLAPDFAITVSDRTIAVSKVVDARAAELKKKNQ